MPQHVLSARQFSRSRLETLFARTVALESSATHQLLSGRIMATLFYEPSTRTRLSFESAMVRLGGQVITTENAREFSSAVKGEAIEDTIRVVSGYADVIVMRHYEEGSAARAAEVATVPVINAGDGPGEHPTQALLDLYTIYKECGRIDGLTIALAGDLAHGRTVHSLAYLLTNYAGVRLLLVSPEAVPMPASILRYLDEAGFEYHQAGSLDEVASQAQVIYQTRIQKERFASEQAYQAAFGRIVIDPRLLEKMPDDAIIMHPLPRAGEIDPRVDADPRAAYFRQAHNGVIVRMGLLMECLEQDQSDNTALT